MKKMVNNKVESSSHLKELKKEFEKNEKVGLFLNKELRKFMIEKEKIRARIKKEKEIIDLRNKIERVRKRKK